jgi:hypothetical protein
VRQGSSCVVISRGWADWRKAQVPVAEVSGLHVTRVAGGTRAPLPRPVLAGYISCDVIPEDGDFGHSCTHGAAPHRIKVLILKGDNTRQIYELLRGRAVAG